MTADFLLSLSPLIFFAGVALGALLYRRIYGVRDRTAEDVLPFLRPVDLSEVHDLFNASAERYLRLNLTPRHFRRAQRQRIHLALEYIRRISHNALILQEWGTYEMARLRPAGSELGHFAVDLIAASVHCRMCSFVLRARLHTWLFRMALLPFLAPPSFDMLIKFGSADLLEFYGKLRSAAGELSRCYGDANHTRLAQLL